MSYEAYLPYVNVPEGLGRVANNKMLFARLVKMCQASTEFQKFEDAVVAGDPVVAGNVAHAIKGMCGNLSMTALFNASAKLCDSLRSGVWDEELLATYRSAVSETLEILPALLAELA
jgi:FOG: HPt domain